jgi:hypothetical protein
VINKFEGGPLSDAPVGCLRTGACDVLTPKSAGRFTADLFAGAIDGPGIVEL